MVSSSDSLTASVTLLIRSAFRLELVVRAGLFEPVLLPPVDCWMTCRLGPVLRDEDDCAAAAERDDWINADARGPEVLCDIKLVIDDTDGTLLFRLGESPEAVDFLGGIGGGRAMMVGTETCRCRNGLLVE